MSKINVQELKDRAALWSAKADKYVADAMALAEQQAAHLRLKADTAYDQAMEKGQTRSEALRARGQIEKADAAYELGKTIAKGKAALWNNRADALLSRTAEIAEFKARVWRDRAAELLRRANENV